MIESDPQRVDTPQDAGQTVPTGLTAPQGLQGPAGEPPVALAPRVSVIIPAYNEEAYIRAAITSVAAQDYPLDRLECIVVDNASTDTTVAVATECAAECADLTIRVISEREKGPGAAKNRGARVATGDVLLFLDADSRMHPHLSHDIAASYRAGIPAGTIRIVSDSRDLLERGFFALMEVGPLLFDVQAQMLYCDRALFLALGGFRTELHLAEDLEFLQRVQARAGQDGKRAICHLRNSPIATSPRRLREMPFHLSIATVFVRWVLAFAGYGRRRQY